MFPGSHLYLHSYLLRSVPWRQKNPLKLALCAALMLHSVYAELLPWSWGLICLLSYLLMLESILGVAQVIMAVMASNRTVIAINNNTMLFLWAQKNTNRIGSKEGYEPIPS